MKLPDPAACQHFWAQRLGPGWICVHCGKVRL